MNVTILVPVYPFLGLYAVSWYVDWEFVDVLGWPIAV